MTEKKTKKNAGKEKVEVKGSRHSAGGGDEWGISGFISGLIDEIPFRLTDIAKLVKSPRMDVIEKREEFIVVAEVPGVDKKDISLETDENILTISGSRKEKEGGGEETFLRKEIRRGNFSRSFTFPLPVEPSSAEAKYSGGVLRVSLPKKEVAEKTKVEVKNEL